MNISRLIVCYLALLVSAAPCLAGGITVSPLRIDFSAERNVAVITVSNAGSELLHVEAEAMVWPADAAGQSVGDITINPPMLSLAPGAKAIVRIGLTRRLANDVERAYRIYFTELPKPLGTEAVGLGVRLRVGVPIFVGAAQPQPRPLQWSAQRDGDDVLLTAHNPGNVHQRVTQLASRQDSAMVAAVQGLPYVLPSGTASFRLPAKAVQDGGTLALHVRTDQGSTPLDLRLP